MEKDVERYLCVAYIGKVTTSMFHRQKLEYQVLRTIKTEQQVIGFDEFIREATRKIVAEFDPEKIILFGSHAYGKIRKYSDVDLLIIMRSDLRPALRSTEVYRLFRPHPVAMDIMVRTPEEVKYRTSIGDFFIQEILTKGKTLYERQAISRMD